MSYLKFENTEIFNFEGAIRGMRNPMNSWDKSDSKLYEYINAYHPMSSFKEEEHCIIQIIGSNAICFKIGSNDLDLCKRLIKGGSEHRKFLQQIFVSVDITAPRFWWQEMDTYRVGIVKNSCSTMHKIHSRLLIKEDFEYIDDSTLNEINKLIQKYNDSDKKDMDTFLKLKSLLPEGFYQMRTVTMNYENLFNIYRQRKSHRLPHWREDFMTWLKELPCMNEFLSVLEQGE